MKNDKNETAQKNSFENWINFQLKFGYLFLKIIFYLYFSVIFF
jgi:hypothetical protein